MRSAACCGLLLASMLAGCSTLPEQLPSPALVGRQIADHAVAQVGRPYLYGGNGPESFDCSGLVRFVHLRAGIETPRTTLAQFQAARPVIREEIEPGDLLFFKFDTQPVSHVAIYTGTGRFVHAPQTGRPVELREMQDPAYTSRLVKIGRLH